MDEQDKLRRAFARLHVLKEQLESESNPGYVVFETVVSEYHSALDHLGGHDVQEFRIPDNLLFQVSEWRERCVNRTVFMAKLRAVLLLFQLKGTDGGSETIVGFGKEPSA